MRNLFIGSVLGAIALMGCGGGDGGSGGGGGSTTTATGGAGGSTVVVECTGTTPSFPEFDRACAAATDCVIGFHQINCCGTRTAMGIASTAQSDFAAAEATCESQYPGCGCAQGPTMTDEGSTAIDEAMIQVQCSGGMCMTYVP
ncbi:MAG: hypothetical protein U0441_12925 [Polyangiaceae bacterium]